MAPKSVNPLVLVGFLYMAAIITAIPGGSEFIVSSV
jgi:hypothetical protein